MLLDSAGHVVADRWVKIADDADIGTDGAVIVSIARLAQAPQAEVLGVELAAGVELASIVPHLARLGLVAVPFPGFRDGRGFSAARALRERHGFTGEIRATGHLLPDQYVALLRVGVTSIELPDDTPLEPWREALRLGEHWGQGEQPLPLLRRAALPFAAT